LRFTNSPYLLEIPFYKFHGTGNDFILVDDREKKFSENKEVIEHLCDRHFGIGADGLILLQEEKGYDFRMVYFNSDGRESTMCGNGGRCTIAFADFLSLVGPEVRFVAVDGEHYGLILGKGPGKWQVRLRMADVTGYRTFGDDLFIDTGSPHLVRFSEGVKEMDVFHLGRKVRYSTDFSPGGTNADFAENTPEGLFVRSYERGVENETLSCGTGVTASVLAHAIRNGLDRGTVVVDTLGGRLGVTFEREQDRFTGIWLEGPAVMSFRGKIQIDS